MAEPTALARCLPYVVIANFALVCAALVALGRLVTARPLEDLPGPRQNAAELALEWFVEESRRIGPAAVRVVAPFLATLFFTILGSNLLALLPVPLLRIAPTSYYSGPLALALVAVGGVFAISARLRGPGAALRHLFWPNPLELVGEASHALSLSLRLFGNIGGEVVVASLAAQAAPYGIPLVIHALGLFPVAIQPFVFTILTLNFIATAAHGGSHEGDLARPHPDAHARAGGDRGLVRHAQDLEHRARGHDAAA